MHPWRLQGRTEGGRRVIRSVNFEEGVAEVEGRGCAVPPFAQLVESKSERISHLRG